MLSVLPH
ncbi:hypothetical protein E2C01_093611 [Portunus trituberculatus]|nr:hypothetical protein [Portunus trituberculatus]